MNLPVVYASLKRWERKAVRELYVKEQHGRCYYCTLPLDGPPHLEVTAAPIEEAAFPPGFLNYPIHLHHSHKTGLTLGAVHARCNAVLWQYLGE